MNEVNKEMVNDKMVNNKWLRHVGYGLGDMSGLERLELPMVDLFMDHGYSYFDTAYIYPGSEEMLRRALVERYPRGSYQTYLAAKESMKHGDYERAQLHSERAHQWVLWGSYAVILGFIIICIMVLFIMMYTHLI